MTRVHPGDNVLVALANLEEEDSVIYKNEEYSIFGKVPAKQKTRFRVMKYLSMVFWYVIRKALYKRVGNYKC